MLSIKVEISNDDEFRLSAKPRMGNPLAAREALEEDDTLRFSGLKAFGD